MNTSLDEYEEYEEDLRRLRRREAEEYRRIESGDKDGRHIQTDKRGHGWH